MGCSRSKIPSLVDANFTVAVPPHIALAKISSPEFQIEVSKKLANSHLEIKNRTENSFEVVNVGSNGRSSIHNM